MLGKRAGRAYFIHVVLPNGGRSQLNIVINYLLSKEREKMCISSASRYSTNVSSNIS